MREFLDFETLLPAPLSPSTFRDLAMSLSVMVLSVMVTDVKGERGEARGRKEQEKEHKIKKKTTTISIVQETF